MSNNDGTIDFGGVSTDPEARHLALADVTNSKVANVFETVTRIEDKVDHLIGELNALASQVERLPSGITLINAVGQILDTVKEIKQQL